jgi:hypothetical protein
MMEGLMAKVIEFYVSEFWPTRSNYIARKEGGKLIEFRSPKRNQANSHPLTGQQYMVYIAPFAANSASGRTGDNQVSNARKKVGDPDEELR